MSSEPQDTGKSKVTLVAAFACAARGIAVTAKGRNFKIELGFAIAALILGIICSISTFEWLVVAACCGMVLGGEVLNTALEAVVDLVSPDYNELAGLAKDCAAGAVLCFAIASFIIGVIIYLPKLLHLIGLM